MRAINDRPYETDGETILNKSRASPVDCCLPPARWRQHLPVYQINKRDSHPGIPLQLVIELPIAPVSGIIEETGAFSWINGEKTQGKNQALLISIRWFQQIT